MRTNRIGRLESWLRTTALAGVALAAAVPVQAQDFGLLWDGPGPLVYSNDAGLTLGGTLAGVYGRGGALALTNLGTIEGLNAGWAGVVLEQAGSSVSNLGLISGVGFGIVAQPWYNPETDAVEWLTTDTVVTNAAGASIIGANNDGVRLAGGGSVTNAGTIVGQVGALTDGISIFGNPGQTDWLASVSNARGGTIEGARFGIILGGTGSVTNAASGPGGSTARIAGGQAGILIQSVGGTTDTATVSNGSDGLVTGAAGILFGGSLASSTLVNDGVITGTFGAGVSNEAPGTLAVTNTATGSITGSTSGVLALQGPVEVVNHGSIRGNGSYDGFESTPDGGISIGVGPSSVDNYGSITGAGFGVTTFNYLNSNTGEFEPRAVNTTVINRAGAQIIGDSNDGVRLIGGGTVTNAGNIEGRVGTFADGVSIFAAIGQDSTGMGGSGTVTNLAGGTISGNRFGITMQGGIVDNAGSIDAADFSGGTLNGYGSGILIQGIYGDIGKTGTITNSGSISGGTGITLNAALESGSVTNSGSITGRQYMGIDVVSLGPATIDNLAGGTITGAKSGILAHESAITLTNAGSIRGNGSYDGFAATPDGGISIGAGGSSVDNSGSITGGGFGITTYNYYNPGTGLIEPRAVNTTVINRAGGQIVGDSNDGVRLIGGGTVTNSGNIEGRVGTFADGVSMFALEGQDTTGQSGIGTVTNLAGGTISGNRFGVTILGGTVNNDGSIWAPDFSGGTISGFGSAILIQTITPEPGKTGTINNNGLISGGTGITLNGTLATASVTNSGTIIGRQSIGIDNTSNAAASIDNLAGGSITGTNYGARLLNGGSVDNAGTMSGFFGAILISGQAANPGRTATVTNSGTLNGGAGILFGGPDGNVLASASVTNSGTIAVTQGPAVFVGFEGLTTITNLAGASMTGSNAGVLGRNGAVAVTNAGTIIGNGGGNNGGIVIEQAGSSISNSGLIRGNSFGITANPFFNAGTGLAEARAIGTSVTNTGTIRGSNNDGVRLQGGGSITNSGLIEGLAAVGADGISMFSLPGQDTASMTSIGTVTNLAGGSIRGNRFGIILSNGGTIGNAGSIWAPDANAQTFDGRGTAIVVQDGENLGNKIATITNSGDVSGGNGIGFGGTLAAINITNSGSITGRVGDGISGDVGATLTIDNLADGSITGGRSGVYAEWGPLALTNAGSIRGNGSNGNFTRTDAGLVIVQPGSIVDNSGSITGARFGLTTAYFIEDVTENYLGLALGTAITNSGTIRGDNDDGIRLVGGGTVTNSGLIEGLTNSLADGVSMFAFEAQDVSTMTSIGTVTNLAGGTINGNRNGVILSNGGRVENDGTIWAPDLNAVSSDGFGTAVVIQNGGTSPSATGTIVNTGTLAGGNGVGFGGGLASASLSNSGSITGRTGDGIGTTGAPVLQLDNLAGGSITGAASGVNGTTAALTLTNAGSIRGNGTSATDERSDAGVVILQPGSSVGNSGTISGAGFGITTNYYVTAGGNQGLATGTSITNLAGGSIIGDSNDGVRLIGGGTVTNAGIIEGRVGSGADGVSMFTYVGQDATAIASIGTLTNQAGGSIYGKRFGVVLQKGGEVDNAGSISGDLTGVVIRQTAAADAIAEIARLTNTGSISGGVAVQFSGAMPASSLTNSGSITGTSTTDAAIRNDSTGKLTLTNLAGGSIISPSFGIIGFGAIDVTNAGSITSTTAGKTAVAIVKDGSRVTNSGTITAVTAAVRDFGASFGTPVNGTVVHNSGTIGVSSATGTAIGLENNGVITNESGGTITGSFALGSGAIVVTNGDSTITNAGTITGAIRAGGNSLTLNNSGVLDTYITFSTSSTTINNSGTIAGRIQQDNGGPVTIINSGTIEASFAVVTRGRTNLVNTGTITGLDGTPAVLFYDSYADDTVTLGAGSSITGSVDAGFGFDRLRLDSGSAQTQVLDRFDGFEQLDVLSGSWLAPTYAGTFDYIDVTGGWLTVTGGVRADVWIANSGVFQLGTGGSVGSFEGDIVNFGNLIIDIGADFDITGVFAGNGVFTKDGSATVSFLGEYNFTGVTNLLAGGIRIAGAMSPDVQFNLVGGTLDLSGSTGTEIAGLSGTEDARVILGDQASLTVNQDIDTVFAGNISGSGSLIKEGGGRLNLTGTNSYAGDTIVEEGVLSVNGSITSDVTVRDGATLGGTGTTGVVTIESGGAFNPGNSIGTIRVTGALTFASGARYEVEVNPARASDLITATGGVTIAADVTVEVQAAFGVYRPTTKYTILSSSQNISGHFAGVSSDLAFLEPSLVQSARKVELQLKNRGLAFASVANTSNQANVAAAVQTLGAANPLYLGVLSQSASGARAAFDTLSGGFFASLSNRMLAGAARAREMFQPLAAASRPGLMAWSRIEPGARTASSADYRSGVALSNGELQVQMVSGYVPFQRLATGDAGNASVETVYSGGSLAWATGAWRVQGGVGMGWYNVDASRRIGLGGFGTGPGARYQASTQQLFGEVAYTANLGALALAPFAGVTGLRLSGSDIREAGSAAALSIEAQGRSLGIATTGVRLGVTLPLGSGATLMPRAAVAWQWAGGDLGVEHDSRFAGSAAGFIYTGNALASSGIDLDAGLQLNMGRMTLSAGYRRNTLFQAVDDGAEIGLGLRF